MFLLRTQQAVLLTLVALVIGVLAVSSVAYANGGSDEYVRLDEDETVLKIGDAPVAFEIGQSIDLTAYGASRTTHGCAIPKVVIGASLSGDTKSGEVSILLNGDDCSLEVEEVTSERNSISGTQVSTEYKSGWAQSELHDPPHLPLTSVYARMHYRILNESIIGWGSLRSHTCSTLYSLWNIDDCTGSWSPTGPSMVSIRTEGEFHHSWLDPSEHWQMAEFYAWPQGADYWCMHEGNVVGPTHWDCNGHRESN